MDKIKTNITPPSALQLLKEGNFRLINDMRQHYDLLEQVDATQAGQYPFAAVLACMDSRTSSELVFDLGLGDIFSIRIAGNIVTEGILGSLEYATAVAGSSLILVLGHTNCGAIKGACDHVEMGNLTGLLQKIQPAIDRETDTKNNRNSSNKDFVDAVALLNVQNSVAQIVKNSPIIKQLVAEGKVGIVPAIYDVATGKVRFCDDAAIMEKAHLEHHLQTSEA